MTRVSIERTSLCVPTVSRFVTGSATVTRRFEVAHRTLHGGQMRLEAEARRAVRVELQQSTIHPLLQVDADGAHVAHQLRGRLLEKEIQATLATPAGGIHEMGRQARLAGARGSGEQDGAAAVVTRDRSTSHPVARRPSTRAHSIAGCVRPSEVTGSTLSRRGR